ncbi:2OG-Fe(II) oxygenase [Paenibacillus tarimensis]|uniref:2OG-Fe(II) oxygenase n=1 Tax=Paenibacillus tarimensis TaxID=416012 RepID=UPI001F3B1120|nr:2OG-Fe(II) oxygenase [Paenibacillus tarimensis]MCF2945528.1 2OG-Fe(II) oxygenase [Paenibacillus tarimensis]
MSDRLNGHIPAIDWTSVGAMINEQGFALLPGLLDEDQCQQLINTYDDESLFRKTIQMARYRFGEGEYKYYQAPLPPLIEQLRNGIYPELAKLANEWLVQIGQEGNYPATLQPFLELCHERGQLHPTPLILQYVAGGYNCLHQDLYGEVFFPFQVVIALNRRDADYTGGEFLLVEQRPRAQSRGHAITIDQGSGLIFPTSYRPVQGSRGYYKTTMRHGVSTITSGQRYSLGIIFHDGA